MGRGQSRSRALAASRKVAALKRSMKAAVRRAQKPLLNSAKWKQEAAARSQKIIQKDIQARQANKRARADGEDFMSFDRRGRRNEHTEARDRRDEQAPRYDAQGRPTGKQNYGAQMQPQTNAPKYTSRVKDADRDRRTDSVQRGPDSRRTDVAGRRDRNTREVGGRRAREYIDRTNAAARTARRNQRRRQRYKERKAFGSNAPRSRTRQSVGISRSEARRILSNFFDPMTIWYIFNR